MLVLICTQSADVTGQTSTQGSVNENMLAISLWLPTGVQGSSKAGLDVGSALDMMLEITDSIKTPTCTMLVKPSYVSLCGPYKDQGVK